MDSSVAIWGLLVYLIICLVISQILKTKHKSFWWMVFLSPPVGAIVALLLDIRETTEFNFIRLRDIEHLILTKNR